MKDIDWDIIKDSHLNELISLKMIYFQLISYRLSEIRNASHMYNNLNKIMMLIYNKHEYMNISIKRIERINSRTSDYQHIEHKYNNFKARFTINIIGKLGIPEATLVMTDEKPNGKL